MKTPSFIFLPHYYRATARRAWQRTQPRLRLRQALVVALIAAMILTALPLAERFTPPAQAQGTGINHPCVNAAYQIIQSCKLGGNYESELENAVINDLLKVHNLPASERSRLLGWERGKIRAGIFGRIVGYINKPAYQRSADEQAIVTALTNRVKARRIMAATKAIDEFHRWQVSCPYNPPAPFPPDNSTCSGIGFRAVPTFEQFQAYGAVAATSEFQDPQLQQLLTDTGLGFGYISSLVGSGLALAAASTYLWSFAVVASFLEFGTESTLTVPIVLPAVVSAANTTGPIALFIYAVLTAVVGTILVVEESQLPGKLDLAKTEAENATPDMVLLLTTDSGKREILGELAIATMPDFPAASGVPAAQASDPKFEASLSGLNTFTAKPELQYIDWDSKKHTVRMNGRWFVDQKESEAERLTLSIEYLNSDGKKRLASRVGSEFLISDLTSDKAAPVKTAELRYLNWSAVSYVARIIDSPPTITAVDVTRSLGGFFVPVPIAEAADADDSAELLTVAATSPLSSNGVTLSGVTLGADGVVKASISAPSCPATDINAAFTLQVTDTRGQSATATVHVTVPANVPPVLTYAPMQSLVAGGSTTVAPISGPSDPDGSVYNQSTFSYVTVGQPKITPISPTAPPFAGTVSLWHDSGPINLPTPTGKIDISNAGPIGAYRVELPVTDGCGVTTVGTFTLNVTCLPVNLINVLNNPTCYGVSNGKITVNASPNVSYLPALPGRLIYSINNGQSFSDTNVFTGLAAGAYDVVVKDADRGCISATQRVTLTQPAEIKLTTSGLPNGDVGTAYSAPLSVSPADTYSISVTSGSLPPGLTLDASSGLISGTPTQTGLYNFRVTASGTGGLAGCGGFRDYSINITGCAAITLGPATLASGTTGTTYSQTVSASPAGAYSYNVTAGALPMGLSLNIATGAITGTPQQAGTFSFTITASLGGCSASRGYSMTVGCATVTLPALGGATAGTSFAGSVAASPAGSYNYSLLNGGLPGGLSLNTTTGAITGTPTTPGTYGFTLRAQATNGCSGSQAYSLVVGCPVISLSDLPTPSLNAVFNQALTATPAGGGYSFAVTAGALPAGLSLNAATGLISGTPMTAGAYSFTITATKFGACTGSRTYTGTVAGATCPTIALADLPAGATGQTYSAAVTASPAATYGFAVTAGSLPPGLTLYGSVGLIFGYPMTAGNYNFTITATDANNCTGSKQYNLDIGGAALNSAVFGDFDGDGRADLSVWRGASGEWQTVNSKQGQLKSEAWGSSAAPYFDAMTPGDYDGDGKMDLAVFRKSTGEWWIKCSKDGATITKLWGLATDVPVPGDYDGDGKTDIAVWRGAETTWYILRSSDGQTETISWGTSKAPYLDVPVPGDYDGDGKTDIAVFRQANGHWYIRQSSNGQVIDKFWGLGTDIPVAADYDGDGKTDIAVWRGAENNWYVLRSSDGTVQTITWGASSLGDVPVPGDYDGDGKADVTVWRESDGTWQIRGSRDEKVITKSHGARGDRAVTGRMKP